MMNVLYSIYYFRGVKFIGPQPLDRIKSKTGKLNEAVLVADMEQPARAFQKSVACFQLPESGPCKYVELLGRLLCHIGTDPFPFHSSLAVNLMRNRMRLKSDLGCCLVF